jgi:hypothetical protein
MDVSCTSTQLHIDWSLKYIINILTPWNSAFWEANSRSAIQDFLLILFYTKVHCIVTDESSLHFPALFLKYTFNIVLLSVCISFECSHLRFKTKIMYNFYVPSVCYMACPSHSSWLIIELMFGEEYKFWSASLCSFLEPSDSLIPKYSNTHN